MDITGIITVLQELLQAQRGGLMHTSIQSGHLTGAFPMHDVCPLVGRHIGFYDSQRVVHHGRAGSSTSCEIYVSVGKQDVLLSLIQSQLAAHIAAVHVDGKACAKLLHVVRVIVPIARGQNAFVAGTIENLRRDKFFPHVLELVPSSARLARDHRSTIGLGHDLGLTVVAEGEAQLAPELVAPADATSAF